MASILAAAGRPDLIVGHLSDIHLGRKSPGDPLGAIRLQTLRRALARLATENPAAIVIAGDVFDGPRAEPALVTEAARILQRPRNSAGNPVPLVVVPGNHDPADSTVLWKTFAGALNPDGKVHLCLKSQFLRFADDRLLIEAYPCETRFSAEPPWRQRLDASNAAEHEFRVVVAHGTLQGGQVPEGETDAYPFAQTDLEALGADYIALGHFHSVYPAWGTADVLERAFSYSSTPEPDQYNLDAGFAVVVELRKGQPTRLRRERVAQRDWALVDVAGAADLRRMEVLRKQIEQSDNPAAYVVRLRVAANTRLQSDEAGRLDEFEAALASLGAHVERRGEVQRHVDASALDLRALPSGAVREALLSLQADLETSADPGQREILEQAVKLGWDMVRET